MTFYKKLQKALDNKGKGAFVLVQRSDKEYCIFSPIKDRFGDYRESGWWKTEEEAKKLIGCLMGYSEDAINILAKEQNWKIIKIYSLQDLM